MRFYNNRLLVSACTGWPNGKKTCIYFHPNLSPTKVNVSRHKLSQVDASQCKWVGKWNASWTQVQNLCQLASLFGQGFRFWLSVYSAGQKYHWLIFLVIPVLVPSRRNTLSLLVVSWHRIVPQYGLDMADLRQSFVVFCGGKECNSSVFWSEKF